MEKNIAYISIGGNIGDTITNMQQSISRISLSKDCKLKKISNLYKTPPWGNINQPYFYNACVQIDTKLKPGELLDYCQSLEIEFGRQRKEKWGPRTLDLDILLMSNYPKISTEKIKLPHPHMLERAFVLFPLQDIAENLIISNKNIKHYISLLNESDLVSIQIEHNNKWREMQLLL